MDDILSVVRASLATHPTIGDVATVTSEPKPSTQIFIEEEQSWDDHDNKEMGHVFDQNEVLFDDTGEGAGVEGDLDMEED